MYLIVVHSCNIEISGINPNSLSLHYICAVIVKLCQFLLRKDNLQDYLDISVITAVLCIKTTQFTTAFINVHIFSVILK